MKKVYSVAQHAALIICAALSLATVDSFAQGGGTRPTPIGRRIEHLNRQVEQSERDNLTRDLKGDNQPDRKRAKEAAAQARKDIEDLQNGYNQIVLDMASRHGLNHDSISGAVTKVNRCAARLKDNLALPRPKDNEEQKPRSETASGQLEESLMMLRKHLYSFLTNPLFESPTVLDVEQAGKASRDLDEIIELSAGIRKSVDKLKKATKP